MRIRSHRNTVPSVEIYEQNIIGRKVIDIPLLWNREPVAPNRDEGAMSQVSVIRLDAMHRNELQNNQRHDCYHDQDSTDLEPRQHLL